MERYLPSEEEKVNRNRFVLVDDKESTSDVGSDMRDFIINFNNTPDDEDDSDFYDEDLEEATSDNNLIEIDVKADDSQKELLKSSDAEDFEDEEEDEYDADFEEEEIIDEEDIIDISDSNEDEKTKVNEDIEEDIEIVEETKETEGKTNTQSNLIDVEEDIKVNIFKSLSEYFPMTMRLDKNSAKEISVSKKGIVIEKLGEEIIAVENLGFIPFYVKGEKENLVVRENNLTNYIEWLKNDVIKRYNNGITIEEFDKIEKLIIVENASEMLELNSNETYITRAEALDRLAQKYDVVIDLTMNNCHIKFNDNNVSCSIDVEGLGYKIASSTDWAEEISNKLSCFKNRNIIFLGIAGNEKLLKELNEKFNIESKRNFESLAWEIL